MKKGFASITIIYSFLLVFILALLTLLALYMQKTRLVDSIVSSAKNSLNGTRIVFNTQNATISGGGAHSLAIDENGQLWSWGYNNSGQLGNGDTTEKTIPIKVKEGTKFTSTSAGEYHSLAIDESGELWTWGANSYGQLGEETTLSISRTPLYVKNSRETKWVAVSAARYHSLAIDKTGQLWGWGNNEFGQVGNGAGAANDLLIPREILFGRKTVSVSAGEYHSLAIDNEGYLYGWGLNSYYQVGEYQLNTNCGSNLSSGEPVIGPLKLGYDTSTSEYKKFVSVAAGYNHSLAIDTEGYIWSWGSNQYGQLGYGNTEWTCKSGYKIINPEIKFISISAGENYSLAIDETGQLWAWGYNGYGQLGNGTTSNVFTPQKISEGTKFVSVEAGGEHTVAVDNKGQVYTWGDNSSGQLGDGSTIDKIIPNVISLD